jgi:ATP-dependent Clp protease ATP-binding subunit ClpA
MKLDNVAGLVFNAAYNEAKLKKHEYFTPEHLLFAALFFDESIEILENCGGDIEGLKDELNKFFNEYIKTVETDEPIESAGLHSVMHYTGTHALSSEKNLIKIGDILVAIYDQEESFASYFMKKDGIKRIDILNYISHGISAIGDFDIDEFGSDEDFDYDIDEEEVSFEHPEKNQKSILANYTTVLTEKVKNGEIDPIIGREDVLKRTLQVLARRLKNNPIHVGDPGVGKTAITEGLAHLIVSEKVPSILKGSKIFNLDMGGMLAGTKYRGDFEERIKKVLTEISHQEKPIVYIDEIHTVVGAGAVSGGSMDASNILKPFLSDGKIKFIGSTTYEEYKKYFEKDRALSRRFQKIEIKEPSVEETVEILKGLKESYEQHHNVKYTDEAIYWAAELSAKYINDRHLPDKAIDVIDETGAYIRLLNESDKIITVDAGDIERTVSLIAKIPEKSVSTNEINQLKNLENELNAQVFGQEQAITTISKAIKRSRAGFDDEEKPVASLLFVGPTGVGKTEVTKQLAKTLGIKLIRFDMSEYQEKHSVARLIGAPPGYVGYDEGGLLTEAVRKSPYSVLLLDEIEKAHQDIFNVLLQVMDYATLTENNGKKADFRNVIIIMTSNAGAREVGKVMIGFEKRKENRASINKAVERIFSPEFRNRLDEVVVFNGIDKNMALLVAKKEIKQFREKLKEKNVKLTVTTNCYEWLAKKGFSSDFGAREILRVIQDEIKAKFVDEVLFGELKEGGSARVDVKKDEVNITYKGNILAK